MPVMTGAPGRVARTRAPDPVVRAVGHLTVRDATILEWLHDHRMLTTPQLAGALFPSVHVAQRRMRLLRGLGLVERFRPLKQDGGSYPYHWMLDHVGAVLVALREGMYVPRPSQSRAQIHALSARAN